MLSPSHPKKIQTPSLRILHIRRSQKTGICSVDTNGHKVGNREVFSHARFNFAYCRCEMNLPAEILDHIFSFLQADPTSLRACSKSHPSLSQLAEPYLYSHIVIKAGESSLSDRPSNLAELLSKRPHIAHYIHNLEIWVIGDSGIFDHHIQCHLEEISNLLPMLLALRQIALNHAAAQSFFQWETQPESFRLAFLACLRLPSMQDVSLTRVFQFPWSSLVNFNEYKSLRGLALQGYYWTNRYANVAEDGLSNQNGSLPFESLCIQGYNREGVVQKFTDWAATCLPRLRSLKFSSQAYHSLVKLLTSCSTTLVNLSFDIGSRRSCMSPLDVPWIIHTFIADYYNFMDHPPTINQGRLDTPFILSMLPYLEALTIHSELDYTNTNNSRQWGFHSAIPTITELFSREHPSSLKHLTLDFGCVIDVDVDVDGTTTHVLHEFPLPLSVSNVLCVPLVELLSIVSAFSPSIQVNLFFDGNPLTAKSIGPLNFLLSALLDCEELLKCLWNEICLKPKASIEFVFWLFLMVGVNNWQFQESSWRVTGFVYLFTRNVLFTSIDFIYGRIDEQLSSSANLNVTVYQ